MIETFQPSIGLRNGHSQSLLNSSGLRRRLAMRRAAGLLAAQQEWILDGGHGIRLKGHYSAHAGNSKGLVVLLHGWEGSSMSNYILCAGARCFAQGFDVFRLNFRDHGGTHGMNKGIFHSCRLDEVIHALKDMQDRINAGAWGIAGYSLGGNFALRTALHGPARGLDISQVVAVCPVLNPAHVLKAMEDAPTLYERYYVNKWERSVRAKQACFPERYAYDDWYELGGLRERTEYFATHYYDFGSLAAYFDGYSIAGDRLSDLAVPGTLLTSEDDPVVPVSDALELPDIAGLDLIVTRHGGHCGYLKNWKLESWAEDLIIDRFKASVRPKTTSLDEQVA